VVEIFFPCQTTAREIPPVGVAALHRVGFLHIQMFKNLANRKTCEAEKVARFCGSAPSLTELFS
jgi:hypothetical protein